MWWSGLGYLWILVLHHCAEGNFRQGVQDTFQPVSGYPNDHAMASNKRMQKDLAYQYQPAIQSGQPAYLVIRKPEVVPEREQYRVQERVPKPEHAGRNNIWITRGVPAAEDNAKQLATQQFPPLATQLQSTSERSVQAYKNVHNQHQRPFPGVGVSRNEREVKLNKEEEMPHRLLSEQERPEAVGQNGEGGYRNGKVYLKTMVPYARQSWPIKIRDLELRPLEMVQESEQRNEVVRTPSHPQHSKAVKKSFPETTYVPREYKQRFQPRSLPHEKPQNPSAVQPHTSNRRPESFSGQPPYSSPARSHGPQPEPRAIFSNGKNDHPGSVSQKAGYGRHFTRGGIIPRTHLRQMRDPMSEVKSRKTQPEEVNENMAVKSQNYQSTYDKPRNYQNNYDNFRRYGKTLPSNSDATPKELSTINDARNSHEVLVPAPRCSEGEMAEDPIAWERYRWCVHGDWQSMDCAPGTVYCAQRQYCCDINTGLADRGRDPYQYDDETAYK